MATLEGLTDNEILQRWDTTLDFAERDGIMEVLQRRGLFPSKAMTRWEYETGAYPSQDDPEFLQKLLAKREFAESLQTTWEPEDDPCGDETRFEVTPVQRFVANLMSPRSPYMSALLYHGVGVGKTCAAVQITEAWLEAFPREKVFLIAPPTIQQGFYRTIFDATKVKIPEEQGTPNRTIGCTGDTYLKLTGTLLERTREKIDKKVTQAIRRRYAVFGYISFANYVRDLLKKIPKDASDERKQMLERDILRREFSGKLLVVDEAHNLRDLPDEISDVFDEEDTPGGKSEKAEAAGGKQLTPYLRKVLTYAEGLKLVLLTATPMYNSYREIIFILNLLLLNDKKATLSEADIFTKNGDIKPGAEDKLGQVAQRYVSFMRGENPRSFPIRLAPQGIDKLQNSSYPPLNPRGGEVPAAEKIYINHLPIVPIPLSGDTLRASIAFMNALPPGTGGLSSIVLEKLVHSGNFIVPATDETRGDTLEAYKKRTDINGIGTVFSREMVANELRFRARGGNAKWLGVDQIEQYSPKFKFLINRLQKAEGVQFVYTRFVNAGALPLSLALEANGYTPYGRKTGLLANGIQTPGGRQCALCEKREVGHGSGEGHEFAPAYYGLLTGDETLSPRNEETIRGERDLANVDGKKMKIIIGSQIASEGVDLRFIREIHVLDSWFHLNKTEQVLGRGIRFCSHSALPREKRNTTIYLYAATLPPSATEKESADLYSYRVAFRKAVQVGRVSRVLKIHAIDCNLNRDAITIQGQKPVRQVDAQRLLRNEVNINDMPFTAVCDWVESCTYNCKPQITVSPITSDDSTYSEFAARWRENRLKDRLRILFERQAFYKDEDLWELFADVPRMSVIDLFTNVIDNRLFQLVHNGANGYIRFCNGYFVFQPNIYGDLSIPLSIRVAKLPVKRDFYTPSIRETVEVIEDKVEEDKPIDTESVVGVWNAIVAYCSAISESGALRKLPEPMISRISEMAHGDEIVQGKYLQIIEIVEWFQASFHKSERKISEVFGMCVLTFFWDNWFTLEEQKFLSQSSAARMAEKMVSENVYNLGRLTVHRFLNPDDGSVVFVCDGGEPCRKSVIDEIARDKDDALRKEVAVENTGELYGFIVPKNGNLVFKTNEPPAIRGKVGRGAECAIVSTMAGHVKKLVKLGSILRHAGFGDFDLRDDTIYGTRKIINATRACCLTELVLRYMNYAKVSGKKWFYRPVASHYTGHKGAFRSGKSLAE